MFNSTGLTAAHKSLPFGTCLVVGNPKIGRSVAVRDNAWPLRLRSHAGSVIRSCARHRHALDRERDDAALLDPAPWRRVHACWAARQQLQSLFLAESAFLLHVSRLR